MKRTEKTNKRSTCQLLFPKLPNKSPANSHVSKPPICTYSVLRHEDLVATLHHSQPCFKLLVVEWHLTCHQACDNSIPPHATRPILPQGNFSRHFHIIGWQGQPSKACQIPDHIISFATCYCFRVVVSGLHFLGSLLQQKGI